MSSVLIVVDVQNGFINDVTQHIPGRVEQIIAQFDTVFVTQFVNPIGSPYRTNGVFHDMTPGSHDTDFAFDFPSDEVLIVRKCTYGCAGLISSLRDLDIRELFICGLDTEACIYAIALQCFDAGITPKIIGSHCASSTGDDSHTNAILQISRMIGSHNIIQFPFVDEPQTSLPLEFQTA